MKKITVRQMAAIKRVAQNVNSLVEKKNKALDKVEKLRMEIEELEKEISGHEVGIKTITDGYTSEDLVVKQVENKFNVKGEEVKSTKYVPSELVTYSEEDKCYYIQDIVEDSVDINTIDEEAKAPEVEQKPSDEGAFDPTKVFTEEDKEFKL